MIGYLKAVATTAAAVPVTAPAASAVERVPVSGSWLSLVNCAFTSYDPLTGRISCLGLTLRTGGPSGRTRYAVTGRCDLLTGDSQGRLHEPFCGRDRSGDCGAVVFDERYTFDGANSTIDIDALAVGGRPGFAGAHCSMTFFGTDDAAPGFGRYAGVLELRRAAR